jgi:hypothetical protein
LDEIATQKNPSEKYFTPTKSPKGKGLLTEKEQVSQLRQIILGQIKAGNNNPQLKKSLKNLNTYLRKLN